jgi:hypothetical protein
MVVFQSRYPRARVKVILNLIEQYEDLLEGLPGFERHWRLKFLHEFAKLAAACGVPLLDNVGGAAQPRVILRLRVASRRDGGAVFSTSSTSFSNCLGFIICWAFTNALIFSLCASLQRALIRNLRRHHFWHISARSVTGGQKFGHA